MADDKLNAAIAKETRRVLNILRAMPMPVQATNLREGYEHLFARAHRRATITVLSTYEPRKEGKSYVSE